jgi:hypothetical protein
MFLADLYFVVNWGVEAGDKGDSDVKGRDRAIYSWIKCGLGHILLPALNAVWATSCWPTLTFPCYHPERD